MLVSTMNETGHIRINGIHLVVEGERVGVEWCYNTMLRALK